MFSSPEHILELYIFFLLIPHKPIFRHKATVSWRMSGTCSFHLEWPCSQLMFKVPLQRKKKRTDFEVHLAGRWLQESGKVIVFVCLFAASIMWSRQGKKKLEMRVAWANQLDLPQGELTMEQDSEGSRKDGFRNTHGFTCALGLTMLCFYTIDYRLCKYFYKYI